MHDAAADTPLEISGTLKREATLERAVLGGHMATPGRRLSKDSKESISLGNEPYSVISEERNVKSTTDSDGMVHKQLEWQIPLSSERVRIPAKSVLSTKLAIFGFTLSKAIAVPLIPFFVISLKGSATDLAYCSTGYDIGVLISGLLAGSLSDFYGRRPVLVTFLGFISFFFIGHSLAPTLLVFFICRLGFGVVSKIEAIVRAYVADFAEDRIGEMADITSWFGYAFIVGPWLPIIMDLKYGNIGNIDGSSSNFLENGERYRLQFLLAGLINCATFIYVYFVMIDSGSQATKRRVTESIERNSRLSAFMEESKVDTRAVMDTNTGLTDEFIEVGEDDWTGLFYIYTACILHGASNFAFQGIAPLYMKNKLGWTEEHFAGMLSASAIGLVAVQKLLPSLHTCFNVPVLCGILMCFSGLLYIPVLLVPNIGETAAYGCILGLSMLGGMGVGLFLTIFQDYTAEASREDHVGRNLGIFWAVYYGSHSVGSIILASMYKDDAQLPFQFYILLNLMLVVVAWVMRCHMDASKELKCCKSYSQRTSSFGGN